MVDLETMGTDPGAAILSLGAVLFDESPLPAHGALALDHPDVFYRVVRLKGQNRNIDPDTIGWWMKQSDRARQAVFPDASDYLVDIKRCLPDFLGWLAGRGINLSQTKIWSQGQSFDIVIIEDIFRQYAQPVPWKYWNHRDTRTLYEECGIDPRKFAPPGGVAHIAWEDAAEQARNVQRCWATRAGRGA
jgi:hypothetical protein